MNIDETTQYTGRHRGTWAHCKEAPGSSDCQTRGVRWVNRLTHTHHHWLEKLLHSNILIYTSEKWIVHMIISTTSLPAKLAHLSIALRPCTTREFLARTPHLDISRGTLAMHIAYKQGAESISTAGLFMLWLTVPGSSWQNRHCVWRRTSAALADAVFAQYWCVLFSMLQLSRITEYWCVLCSSTIFVCRSTCCSLCALHGKAQGKSNTTCTGARCSFCAIYSFAGFPVHARRGTLLIPLPQILRCPRLYSVMNSEMHV